jgi:hypothetical protein
MPEIYVIRPTERAAQLRGVPTAQEIAAQHQALGFIGKLLRVQACGRIVITDGDGFVRIADIQAVHQHPPPNILAGRVPSRVDVMFARVRSIRDTDLQRRIRAIKWAQMNVRYLEI